MKLINVDVHNKIAVKKCKTVYVCGNSDYVIRFNFDAEWDAYETKTARFEYGGKHQDVVFTGSECPVPIISNTYKFNVGVYAGDLRTTTPAYVPCKKSILCAGGVPADPSPDVYNQIIAMLNDLNVDVSPEDIAQAVEDYLAENPIEGKPGKTPVKGEDYWTQADQQQIVADVLSALPTWSGGAY